LHDLHATDPPPTDADRQADVEEYLSFCIPNRMQDVLDVVRSEMGLLAESGISAEELERGKGQLRGGLVLSMEESGTRMSRIAKAELLYDELPGIDEVIRRIDAVTVEDVQILAKELFDQPETLAVVGP